MDGMNGSRLGCDDWGCGLEEDDLDTFDVFGGDPPYQAPKIPWWKSIIMDFSGIQQDASPTQQIYHPLYAATHGGGL